MATNPPGFHFHGLDLYHFAFWLTLRFLGDVANAKRKNYLF